MLPVQSSRRCTTGEPSPAGGKELILPGTPAATLRKRNPQGRRIVLRIEKALDQGLEQHGIRCPLSVSALVIRDVADVPNATELGAVRSPDGRRATLQRPSAQEEDLLPLSRVHARLQLADPSEE